ncbi:hypothetical protein EP073_06775 [Geovibrio thiophilus]|uniref:Flagellar protein FliL n=1 Tax=Geovibrio thiophilus TaxID=139438 RepID=A0A3R5XXF9_9BACT|nr:hypothetical protein [Geovibrio thiophilus]QAR33113.1 hypothetical protein EP073_06775 [Geovibrio thiophilus]
MKSIRYMIMSLTLFILAFGMIYYTSKFMGRDSDFDSFQETAGKGSFSSVEKSKDSGINTILFRGVKLFTDGSGLAYVCTGDITASSADDESAKMIMKYRYDILNYAPQALSPLKSFTPESLKAAAAETSRLYKEKRKIPSDVEFAFVNWNCVPAQ